MAPGVSLATRRAWASRWHCGNSTTILCVNRYLSRSDYYDMPLHVADDWKITRKSVGTYWHILYMNGWRGYCHFYSCICICMSHTHLCLSLSWCGTRDVQRGCGCGAWSVPDTYASVSNTHMRMYMVCAYLLVTVNWRAFRKSCVGLVSLYRAGS